MNSQLNKNVMFGLKNFHLQTIEHEASHPQKTYINFVPFTRFCNPSCLYEHTQLHPLTELLEWIYGYRNIKHDNKRNKRRAPSAGGLYPNELLLLTYIDETWKLLYYSFEKHAFFFIRNMDKGEIGDLFLADRNKTHLFFISVLWKTVQKYGVRGFKYSLLDAGFIGCHLQHIYNKISPKEKIDLILGYQPINEFLPLKKGEEIMYSVSFLNNFKIEKKVSIPAFISVPDNCSYNEIVPCLSTNMIRVMDISIKTFQHQAKRFDLNKLVPFVSSDCFKDIENRLSANAFKNESPETNCLEKIKDNFFKYAHQVSETFGINIHLGCIINKTTDKNNTIELYYTGSNKKLSIRSFDTSKRLQNACQKQVIMGNVAFAFVMFVVPMEIGEWSYFNYSLSILASSFICSNLYFSAMKNQIGTTTIGGFSEKQLMELLEQKNILPIVVQAFGIADTAQLKIDALITQ